MIRIEEKGGKIITEIQGSTLDVMTECVFGCIKVADMLCEGNDNEFDLYMDAMRSFLNDDSKVKNALSSMRNSRG